MPHMPKLDHQHICQSQVQLYVCSDPFQRGPWCCSRVVAVKEITLIECETGELSVPEPGFVPGDWGCRVSVTRQPACSPTCPGPAVGRWAPELCWTVQRRAALYCTVPAQLLLSSQRLSCRHRELQSSLPTLLLRQSTAHPFVSSISSGLCTFQASARIDLSSPCMA
jgi:hypothetical protein